VVLESSQVDLPDFPKEVAGYFNTPVQVPRFSVAGSRGNRYSVIPVMTMLPKVSVNFKHQTSNRRHFFTAP